MKRFFILKEDPVVKELYNICPGLGVRAFLVGGMLRNLFLSLPIGQDYDLVLTPGHLNPAGYVLKMAEKIARSFHGSFFPLDIERDVYRVVIKTGSTLFPLADTEYTKGSPPVSIDLSPVREGDIKKDLRLRDFTMNAIALDLSKLFTVDDVEVIDPLGGREDLKNGLVRACSKSVFTKDAVRLFRGVRFSAVYGLRIEEKTRGYIKEYACMLKGVSGERIRDELFSILGIQRASPYVEDLSSLGLLEGILPYAEGYIDKVFSKTFPTLKEGEAVLSSIPDIAPSFKSELTGYFQENIGSINKAELFKLAALLLDIEGPFSDMDRDKMTVIEKIAAGVGGRLKLSNKARYLLKSTIKHLPVAFNLLTTSRMTDLDMYLFFKKTGRDGISPLLLSLSSVRGKGSIEVGTSRMERILRYLFEPFSEFLSSPLLTGSEIMGLFDIGEGKVIGDIIKVIEEARASGIIKDKEGAVEYIRFPGRASRFFCLFL